MSNFLDYIQHNLIVGQTIPFEVEGIHKFNNVGAFSEARVAPIILSSDKAPPPMRLGQPPIDTDSHIATVTWPFEAFLSTEHTVKLSRYADGLRQSNNGLVLGIGHKASGLITIDLDRAKVESDGITVGRSQRDKELTGLKNLRAAIGDEKVTELIQAAVVTFTPGGGMHWTYDATREGTSYQFPVYSITDAIQTAEKHAEIVNSDVAEIEKRRMLWRMIINSEYYAKIQESFVNVAQSLRGIQHVDIRGPGGPGKCGEYTRACKLTKFYQGWIYDDLHIFNPTDGKLFREHLSRLPAEFVGEYETRSKPKTDKASKAAKKEEEEYYSPEIFAEWLGYIRADDYETCMKIALAMKKELPEDQWEVGLLIFDKWCQRVKDKYNDNEVKKLWDETHHTDGDNPVTGKTVRYLAHQAGWKALFQPGADLGNDHILILLMSMIPDRFLIVKNIQAYAEHEPQGTGLMGFDINQHIWTFDAVDASLHVATEMLKRRLYLQHLINPIANTTGGLARQIRTSLKWVYSGFTKRSIQAATVAVESRAKSKNWGDMINVKSKFNPRIVEFSTLDVNPYLIGSSSGIWNIKHNRQATEDEAREAVVTASTNRTYVPESSRTIEAIELVNRLDDILPEDAREFMHGEISDIILRRARRRFYILIGEGNIGKSSWLASLSRALGGYYDALDKRAISASHEDSTITEYRRSFGRPFRATGLSDGLPTKLSAETLKQVTGGDQTRMRGMRVASAVMEVSAVPLLVCNDTSAPALFVDEQGIRDRLHVIPFHRA